MDRSTEAGELRPVELASDDPDSAFEPWMAVQLQVNPENPGTVAGARARLRTPTNPTRSWTWSRADDRPIGISSVIEVRGAPSSWHGMVVLVEEGSQRADWELVVDHALGIGRLAGATTMAFGARPRRATQRQVLVERGGALVERLVTLERRLDAKDDPVGRDLECVRGRQVVSLGERLDLAAAWLDADVTWTGDIPGETGEQDSEVVDWLAYLDDSPYADRALMWALLSPSGAIDAIVHLERHSIDPETMEIAMLGVARHLRGAGLGRDLKLWLHAKAWRLGVRRLQTINHAGNERMERLNASLGYVQVDEFHSYELAVPPEPGPSSP